MGDGPHWRSPLGPAGRNEGVIPLPAPARSSWGFLENVRYRGMVEYYFAWNGEELVEREGSHPAILARDG